jgi:hypothetical protein
MEGRTLGFIIGVVVLLAAAIGATVWLQRSSDEAASVSPRSDDRAYQYFHRAVMTPYPADRRRLLRKAESAAVPRGDIHGAVLEAIKADLGGDWYAPAAQKVLAACDDAET